MTDKYCEKCKYCVIRTLEFPNSLYNKTYRYNYCTAYKQHCDTILKCNKKDTRHNGSEVTNNEMVVTGSVSNMIDEKDRSYKIMIDDSVSFNEFNAKYKVLKQDGEIFTVVEREVKDHE